MVRFELQTLTDYTDEAILQELRRVAALHTDGPLTKVAYGKLSPKVSSSTVESRFGGWGRALAAAGLPHLSVQPGKAMSDDELIGEMRRVLVLTGRDVLTVRDFNDHSIAHADAVRQRFGSWKAALDKAVIRQAELGKRYTDQECYENIVRLWTHYGRQPQYHELKVPPSAVGPKAYVLRWGSWRKALAAFVEWANAEEQDDSEADSVSIETSERTSQRPAVKPSKFSLSSEDHHEVPLKLKWKVHLRDRFRCLACGKSPANDLTVELHADHISPWADGGKTVLENLQTLCQNCNLGKGKSFGKVEISRSNQEVC